MPSSAGSSDAGGTTDDPPLNLPLPSPLPTALDSDLGNSDLGNSDLGDSDLGDVDLGTSDGAAVEGLLDELLDPTGLSSDPPMDLPSDPARWP